MTSTDAQGDHRIFFANPASNLDQQTFIRVINTANAVGTVIISGVDDNGNIAPNGDVQFQLGSFESKNMNAQDLEGGNAAKGLMGALGDGSGRWQLTVSSALTPQVMNLIRTSDGFVTISGIDDAGNPAPGGDMTFGIDAFAAQEITAVDLENGNTGAGLFGALGDGAGKWRLSINSDVDLAVMSLLDTPTGFLTNLSPPPPPPPPPSGWLFPENIRGGNEHHVCPGWDTILYGILDPADGTDVTIQDGFGTLAHMGAEMIGGNPNRGHSTCISANSPNDVPGDFQIYSRNWWINSQNLNGDVYIHSGPTVWHDLGQPQNVIAMPASGHVVINGVFFRDGIRVQ